MAWWVNITPEVVSGVQSFGLSNPTAVLEWVEHYLSQFGESCANDRWDKCPEDFFVYTHIVMEGGRLHSLVFVVDDASKEVGVLNVVWVEHYPGKPL